MTRKKLKRQMISNCTSTQNKFDIFPMKRELMMISPGSYPSPPLASQPAKWFIFCCFAVVRLVPRQPVVWAAMSMHATVNVSLTLQSGNLVVLLLLLLLLLFFRFVFVCVCRRRRRRQHKQHSLMTMTCERAEEIYTPLYKRKLRVVVLFFLLLH